MTLGPREPGQGSETLRRAHLRPVDRELHLRGAPSRWELVGRTGRTSSAIRGRIGDALVEALALAVPVTVAEGWTLAAFAEVRRDAGRGYEDVALLTDPAAWLRPREAAPASAMG